MCINISITMQQHERCAVTSGDQFVYIPFTNDISNSVGANY